MDNWLTDFIEKDLSELSQEEYEDLMDIAEIKDLTRSDMLRLSRAIPFEIRRNTFYWNIKEGNDKPKSIQVNKLTTLQIKDILKWTDYDYSTNDSLLLHTVKEELDYRNKIK